MRNKTFLLQKNIDRGLSAAVYGTDIYLLVYDTVYRSVESDKYVWELLKDSSFFLAP